jgi:hypothetical protein
MEQVNPLALQQTLEQLTARLTELENRPAQRAEREDLRDDIKSAITPNLQLAPLSDADRKAIVKARDYARFDDIPKPIKDTNGLAGRALRDSPVKPVLINALPGFQSDALDLAHMAAAAWQRLAQPDPALGDGRAFCEQFIKDVLVLSMDNAQRLAKWQLKKTFEISGAKGAYDLMDLNPGSTDLDEKHPSLFQQAHIDALQNLKGYNKSVDTIKTPKTPKTDRRQGNGGRQYGRYDRGNSYRGRGNGGSRRGGRDSYRQGGRGGSHSNNDRNSGNGRMEDE